MGGGDGCWYVGVIYRGVRAGTVAHGVLGRNITLAAFIWRTGPWFLGSVACRHGLCVVLVDIIVLVLVLVWVGWWCHGVR